MKKISVILPCYNVERLIDRCLESLVRQTVGIEKLEIICLDDKSTDGTRDCLHKWEKKYPEDINIVELPVNRRQGNARNVGVQYASSEWIAFVDSDDWVELTYFERMLNAAGDNGYDLVTCGFERDASSDLTLWNRETTGNAIEYKVDSMDLRRSYIIHPPLGTTAWAKLIRRSFLLENELFFPIDLTYEDAAWCSLLQLSFYKACSLEDKLYHYYVNHEATVLAKNSNHHLDCLTVQTQVWREYYRRGCMELYRDELEVEHFFSAYLTALKAIVLRYEQPDYNVYLLLRELMLERISGFRENPYYRNGTISEYHKLLWSAVEHQLSRSDFAELAENIKKIGL